MRAMPIDQPRQVGLYVRQVREERGMTRASLAKAAGVSERLLASLELGDATGIRLDKLLSVLRALDIPLLALLPGTGGEARDGDGRDASDVIDSGLRGQSAEREPTLGRREAKAPASYGDAYRSFMARQGVKMEADDDMRLGEGAEDGKD